MLSQRLIEEKSLDFKEGICHKVQIEFWLTIPIILKVVNFPMIKLGISLKQTQLVLRRVRLLDSTTL